MTDTNLFMNQGTTFGNRIVIIQHNGTPLDLTNCTVVVGFRRSFTLGNTNFFDVAIEDAVNGKVIISMTATETAALTAGRYAFDGYYQLATGEKYPFIQGILTISPMASLTT